MQFKEWLKIVEGLYGTSAAGPLGPNVSPGTGTVSWGSLNNGETGRSNYQAVDKRPKKKRPMRGLAGF